MQPLQSSTRVTYASYAVNAVFGKSGKNEEGTKVVPIELTGSPTCISCLAPHPAHSLLDENGANALCTLCLLAYVGSSDREAVALTLMVRTTDDAAPAR